MYLPSRHSQTVLVGDWFRRECVHSIFSVAWMLGGSSQLWLPQESRFQRPRTTGACGLGCSCFNATGSEVLFAGSVKHSTLLLAIAPLLSQIQHFSAIKQQEKKNIFTVQKRHGQVTYRTLHMRQHVKPCVNSAFRSITVAHMVTVLKQCLKLQLQSVSSYHAQGSRWPIMIFL